MGALANGFARLERGRERAVAFAHESGVRGISASASGPAVPLVAPYGVRPPGSRWTAWRRTSTTSGTCGC